MVFSVILLFVSVSVAACLLCIIVFTVDIFDSLTSEIARKTKERRQEDEKTKEKDKLKNKERSKKKVQELKSAEESVKKCHSFEAGKPGNDDKTSL